MIFTGIAHKVMYNFGYFMAFVKDIPRLVEWKFYEIKYGGKENIPKEIKEKHLSAHVRAMLQAKDYQFSVAVGMLHKHFQISTDMSTTFAMIRGYYHGDLQSQEDYDKITKIMDLKNPRREVFEYMRVKKDLTDHKLNFFSPVGEQRDKLEAWLDMKIQTLN